MAATPDWQPSTRNVVVHFARIAARVRRHPGSVQLGSFRQDRSQHTLASVYVCGSSMKVYMKKTINIYFLFYFI